MVKSRRNLRLIEENSRGRTQEREIKIGGAQERQVGGAMPDRGLLGFYTDCLHALLLTLKYSMNLIHLTPSFSCPYMGIQFLIN